MSPLEKNALISSNFNYLDKDVEDEEKYNALTWTRNKLLGRHRTYTNKNNEWINNIRHDK